MNPRNKIARNYIGTVVLLFLTSLFNPGLSTCKPVLVLQLCKYLRNNKQNQRYVQSMDTGGECVRWS